jgi:elongation factor Ts
MAEFSAKDVQALRQATGAGMMDAKRALEANGGEFDAAAKWLREQGIIKSEARTDRENAQGAVSTATAPGVAVAAELKCETDFVAKSDGFVSVADELAQKVLAGGEAAADEMKATVDDLKVTLKENIEIGRVVRIDAAAGNALDTYLHKQEGRGVNAVIVELAGGSQELAHEVAIHIAFARPKYLCREDVPADEVAAERVTLEAITRAEGKPEAALEKIVEGRLTGWFKERVLLEQPFARDDKQTVEQLLGGASVVRFAQVVIGG